MRSLTAWAALLIAGACVGVLIGLLVLLAAALPAPVCPRSAADLSGLMDDDDPGTITVCLYDVHGRLMNEHHILRQLPPVFPTPILPTPGALQV